MTVYSSMSTKLPHKNGEIKQWKEEHKERIL